MNIFMEVNNYCELKCRFCVADLGYRYPKSNISLDLIDDILCKYDKDKNKAVFLTGGEPLLHPKINEIVKKFVDNNYYTYITTNGQKLKDEKFAVDFLLSGIHRIAIPIYGDCPAIYDKMTGVDGSFESLKKGLNNIFFLKNNYASHIKIELRLLIAKFNISDNERIIDWIVENYPEIDYLTILGLQLSSRTNHYENMIEISMTEAAPYLRSCLNKIRNYGLKCIITGIPPCVLGREYVDFYINKLGESSKRTIKLFPHLSVQPHFKKLDECVYRDESSKRKSEEKCTNCQYSYICEGLQERYVQKYGFNDIKPLI